MARFKNAAVQPELASSMPSPGNTLWIGSNENPTRYG